MTGEFYTDEFYTDDDMPLGAAWSQTYCGDGAGTMKAAGYGVGWSKGTNFNSVDVVMSPPQDPTIMLYGRMPDSGGHPVGARITRDTRCSKCGEPFLQGHVLRADLNPDFNDNAVYHTDCDDPTGQRFADEID